MDGPCGLRTGMSAAFLGKFHSFIRIIGNLRGHNTGKYPNDERSPLLETVTRLQFTAIGTRLISIDLYRAGCPVKKQVGS